MAAFQEYIADVEAGNFPAANNLIEMEEDLLEKVVREIEEA